MEAVFGVMTAILVKQTIFARFHPLGIFPHVEWPMDYPLLLCYARISVRDAFNGVYQVMLGGGMCLRSLGCSHSLVTWNDLPLLLSSLRELWLSPLMFPRFGCISLLVLGVHPEWLGVFRL
ncbi:UNVERIFIED_CONTAM: hypothetical protein Sradi_4463800 [Sesamum radiatum]|uniref:Uncharacterized protein n=1 Tax=Sesamum radiatum TaxID=300843 RepID=A0AAW2NS26_SESRA